MSSEDDRLKASRRRKKNIMAKEINDRKGPYAVKVVNPKKPEYHRIKMRVKEIYEGIYEDELSTDGGKV